MRIIKTQRDFDGLHRAGTLPAAFLGEIGNYFQQLRDELEDEDQSEFRLNRCGYIVVLEAGNNFRDLGNVGLNREDGGLLGSCPEYVELLDLGEALPVYKIVVLYDNDYMMTFYTQAGAHDEEAEPIPSRLVHKALSDFNGLLQTSPVETQKTLIQTIVKQIAVQQGQKLRGIELEFDETLRQCLVVAAPSTDKVDGAFSLSRHKNKYTAPFTIVI